MGNRIHLLAPRKTQQKGAVILDFLPPGKEPAKQILALQKWVRIAGKTALAAAKTCLILLVAALMLWVNFTIDRSGYYHNTEYEYYAALELLAGKDLADYDKLNDRLLNEMYAKNLDTELDVLAVGSSRVKQLTAAIAGTAAIYNAGLSGAEFMDIAGTFYLFDRAGKLPKNLIIGLDPWVLNSNPDGASPRSDLALYEEFLTVCLGIETDYEAPAETGGKWGPLLDPAYFQGNVQYFFEGNHQPLELEKPETVQSDVFNQETNVLRSDGSILYAADFRSLSADEVEARARVEAGTFWRMDNFHSLDPTRLDLFDRFIQYVQSKDVNVIFLLAPYHPTVYAYAMENREKYPGFFLTEPWFASYALLNDIPLYGSYNPFVMETYEDAFYDGLHMRQETLAGILPTLEEITANTAAGVLGSPWLYRYERVPYAAAEHMTYYYNRMQGSETLVRAEDTMIDGNSAYVLQRYSSPGGAMLAQYAVTKDEGFFYRLDTALGQWVHDPQF